MNELEFPNILGQEVEMFFDGEWATGKIVAGYRFRDGIVTIETQDGKRIWCGQNRTDLYRKTHKKDKSNERKGEKDKQTAKEKER